MTIETVSGKFVDPVNPDPKSIDINDIAWSLSRMARFAGHTITSVPYTVGQHSIFVAQMIYDNRDDPSLALYGLLHDAAEAYIGDIPSPVKKIDTFKEYIDKIESNLMLAVYDAVGIEPIGRASQLIVKEYDKRAQKIEAHAFMSSRGKDWIGFNQIEVNLVEYQTFPQPKPALEVYQEFLDMFNFLKDQYVYD
jgi:hypothetical protein